MPIHTLLPTSLKQLDEWVADCERGVDDLRPGVQKEILWHSPRHQVTPWSVVYIHGFSASRLESAPLAERVAQQLGANLFYARLTGHGHYGTRAMGGARVEDWLQDATLALQIGKALGKRVLVIAASTGASLALALAQQHEPLTFDAYAFISPNFGLYDKRAEKLNNPFGKRLARLFLGSTIKKTITDPRETLAWNMSYPTAALFPMLELVEQVRESDLSLFRQPIILFYSETDMTVDAEATKQAFARLGSATKQLEAVNYSSSKGQHVLAGDILAPGATAPIAQQIARWVKTLNHSLAHTIKHQALRKS